MSKEQIEKMAKLIAVQRMYGCNEKDTCDMSCKVYKCGCIPYEDATILYNAGYRELPCKIGDTIYLPWEWNGQKGIACLTVTVLRCIVGFGWSFGTDFDTDDEDYYEAYNCGSFKFKDFGKIVFLSREEAEKVLAKMKGGE